MEKRTKTMELDFEFQYDLESELVQSTIKNYAAFIGEKDKDEIDIDLVLVTLTKELTRHIFDFGFNVDEHLFEGIGHINYKNSPESLLYWCGITLLDWDEYISKG